MCTFLLTFLHTSHSLSDCGLKVSGSIWYTIMFPEYLASALILVKIHLRLDIPRWRPWEKDLSETRLFGRWSQKSLGRKWRHETRKGRQPMNSASLASSAVDSWSLIHWGTLGLCIRITQNEKQGCQNAYSPTPIHHCLKAAPGISSPHPRQSPGEKIASVWNQRLLICIEMAEEMWTGQLCIGPKLINISWMNEWTNECMNVGPFELL